MVLSAGGLGQIPTHNGEKMEALSSGLSKGADPQLEYTRMAIVVYQPLSKTSLWLNIMHIAPGANTNGSHQGDSPGSESPTLTFDR